jgi:hypothetical protein
VGGETLETPVFERPRRIGEKSDESEWRIFRRFRLYGKNVEKVEYVKREFPSFLSYDAD